MQNAYGNLIVYKSEDNMLKTINVTKTFMSGWGCKGFSLKRSEY